MKPDHLCINHPTQEAISICHHCNDWLCSRCVVEGSKHYYCRKPGCLKALNGEEAFIHGNCPSCGKTINLDAVHCGSCGFQLRELTELEKEEDLVTVGRYNNSVEAHIAKTKLESEGIKAYVMDENMISLNPGYNFAFGGVRVQTKKADVGRAKQIL